MAGINRQARFCTTYGTATSRRFTATWLLAQRIVQRNRAIYYLEFTHRKMLINSVHNFMLNT